MNLFFSIIIAVYERQDELTELLESLSKQTIQNYEVLVVDDGSKNRLDKVVQQFQNQLQIRYFYKENSGPGLSRNFGMQHAKGDYFIFLDSDTIVPPNYLENVENELEHHLVDAFGGPDDADESFNDLQKAITFSMTSMLTTGGIRGGKKQISKFQPRSFNMGISRKAYKLTQGFADMRIGEDPDLSMRIWENGLQTRLFPQAKVWHKRRSTLNSFAKQVFQFGVARPILNQRHPHYTKITFWFPSVFFIGTIVAVWSFIFSFLLNENLSQILKIPIFILLIYIGLIFLSATLRFKNLKVGLLAIQTTFIQFFNYGYGFLLSQYKLNVLKQKAETAFPTHFHQP